MRRLFAALLLLGICGGAAFWLLTEPQGPKLSIPDTDPDLATGERMFFAGGCSSCHAAPGAKGDDKLKLGGGLELHTPLGTVRVPNI